MVDADEDEDDFEDEDELDDEDPDDEEEGELDEEGVGGPDDDEVADGAAGALVDELPDVAAVEFVEVW